MLLHVQALLEDGPLKGKTVEIEAVEGRPPMTVDVPDEEGRRQPLLPGRADPGGPHGDLHVPLRRLIREQPLELVERVRPAVAV